MAKVNVSLPDALLGELDGIAEELHRSRSGLVQEATARYVAQLKEERATRERRERIDRAMTQMQKLGRRIPDGPGGTEIVRELRDGPPRWETGARGGEPPLRDPVDDDA